MKGLSSNVTLHTFCRQSSSSVYKNSLFEQLENVEGAICFIDRVLRNEGANSAVFEDKRAELVGLQQGLCDRLEALYVKGRDW
jgi:hypothetical protein